MILIFIFYAMFVLTNLNVIEGNSYATYAKTYIVLQTLVPMIVFMIVCLVPAYISKNKGYSFVKWYIYALLLFPITMIHSIILKEEIFEHINKKRVVSENIIIEYPSHKITCVFDDGSQMVIDSIYSSFYYIKKELQEKGINKNVLYMMNENNDKIYDGESFVFK